MDKKPIYSIGHGSRKIEDFLSLLKNYGIKYLADVRTYPYSRYHPQYSRNSLVESLETINIRYVFMGDSLGGRPKDTSCYNKEGRVDYRVLAAKDFFTEGIKRLKTAYEKDINIAIMCSERNPVQCHRSKLIGKALVQEHITLVHIDENGKLKEQETVIKEINKAIPVLNLF